MAKGVPGTADRRRKSKGQPARPGKHGYTLRAGQKGELEKTEALLYQVPQRYVDRIAEVYRQAFETSIPKNEKRSKTKLEGEKRMAKR